MTDRKEYMKAWKEAHKESEKAKHKAYYQAHKEEYKAYCQAHKEQRKATMKAWKEAHKEERKAYGKAWCEANKESVKAWHEANKEQLKAYHKAYQKEYYKSDVNSLGQRKAIIRRKSQRILKKMNLKIPRYEIHHAFGYEDASKFIYISKSLHSKIHKYLREHNIDADSDHWQAISNIVNSTYEFIYIKS